MPINKSLTKRKLLSDPTLPPFYQIKNYILLAGALEDWEQANHWGLAAEHVYHMSLNTAEKRNDVHSLGVLTELREELDELKEFKLEDETGLTKEEREQIAASNNRDDNDVVVETKEEAILALRPAH